MDESLINYIKEHEPDFLDMAEQTMADNTNTKSINKKSTSTTSRVLDLETINNYISLETPEILINHIDGFNSLIYKKSREPFRQTSLPPLNEMADRFHEVLSYFLSIEEDDSVFEDILLVILDKVLVVDNNVNIISLLTLISIIYQNKRLNPHQRIQPSTCEYILINILNSSKKGYLSSTQVMNKYFREIHEYYIWLMFSSFLKANRGSDDKSLQKIANLACMICSEVLWKIIRFPIDEKEEEKDSIFKKYQQVVYEQISAVLRMGKTFIRKMQNSSTKTTILQSTNAVTAMTSLFLIKINMLSDEWEKLVSYSLFRVLRKISIDFQSYVTDRKKKANCKYNFDLVTFEVLIRFDINKKEKACPSHYIQSASIEILGELLDDIYKYSVHSSSVVDYGLILSIVHCLNKNESSKGLITLLNFIPVLTMKINNSNDTNYTHYLTRKITKGESNLTLSMRNVSLVFRDVIYLIVEYLHNYQKSCLLVKKSTRTSSPTDEFKVYLSTILFELLRLKKVENYGLKKINSLDIFNKLCDVIEKEVCSSSKTKSFISEFYEELLNEQKEKLGLKVISNLEPKVKKNKRKNRQKTEGEEEITDHSHLIDPVFKSNDDGFGDLEFSDDEAEEV